MLTWKENTFFIIEDIFTMCMLASYPVLQEIMEVINLTRRKDEQSAQFSSLQSIYCSVCKAHWEAQPVKSV